MVPTYFAPRLKNARQSAGLTQKELGELSGVYPTNICHFESGNRAPNISNLRALAKALNISADYLLGLDEDNWEDLTDDYSTEINESNPVVTGDYKTYRIAESMVCNRHSKVQLCLLVNWLLVRISKIEEKNG